MIGSTRKIDRKLFNHVDLPVVWVTLKKWETMDQAVKALQDKEVHQTNLLLSNVHLKEAVVQLLS